MQVALLRRLSRFWLSVCSDASWRGRACMFIVHTQMMQDLMLCREPCTYKGWDSLLYCLEGTGSLCMEGVPLLTLSQ